MRIFRGGHYYFSIVSDYGSKLWIDNRYTINNDGLHGWRGRVARRKIRGGWRLVRIEFFERGGHAGMMFRYHGPDTGNRWVVARAKGRRPAARATYRHGLFRENVFYFGQGGRCQNLNNRRPNMTLWKLDVNYCNTGSRWPGFARGTSNHFAVRWTGRLRIYRNDHYWFGIIFDDGIKLLLDNRYTITNDALHGWHNREAAKHLRAGWHHWWACWDALQVSWP